ncbi:PucR family transcriptional regulator [Lacrimispora sp. 210928-DFI.3.58]|uniref:PucR family transcriptional regulator n=1 Tax=Lacrimispora sp. 210928-DFI.3.58 TaxID=2883214 RepID=UPI0015B53688|nr:PucR family transcriptional regulator [Lacrimispora sp. 210928-DFI.3.58]MCB7319661.1 PucR family transcriptional regulator ligand-binding domain-containing protein [Lacrimispora sp. 210928-DFI.3.58]
MTISDFLQLPNFSDLRLLAGSGGLLREVTNVTVVDTPDGSNWLNGGEFVITTAYMLHEEEENLLDFLQTLQLHGAAGLGIKENRYISCIPDSALQLADQLCLPLISVPEAYPFVDIINPVLTQIISRQSFLLTQANMIHKEFLSLAINNNSVPEILQTLRTVTGIPCAFMDTHFKNLYFSDEDSPLMQQLQDVRPESITNEFLQQYDHYAVANKNEQFGFLLFEKTKLKVNSQSSVQTALEYASIVLILRIQIRIANQQMAEKYQAAFLEDLLLNNVKADVEIHNRARLYGWDFTHGGLAAVVDINNIKKYFIDRLDSNTNRMLEEATEIIFRHSIREMHQTFPQAKYFRQSDLIVFILSVPAAEREILPEQLEQTFKRLQAQLANVSPFTITLGIGQYYENIRDISKSYSEARVAINLGYSLQWFDRILFYNRLGLYRLLAPIMDRPEAEELYTQYILPLEDYDRQYHGELLATLQEILQCGWNLKESASRLYIHYNSIKYRYSKICKILNLDLSDHNNRSLVEIAMKLYRLKCFRGREA